MNHSHTPADLHAFDVEGVDFVNHIVTHPDHADLRDVCGSQLDSLHDAAHGIVRSAEQRKAELHAVYAAERAERASRASTLLPEVFGGGVTTH